MNKLPKEKRDRLILVILGTAVILAALYFGLINFQLSRLKSLDNQKKDAQKKAREIDESVKNASKIESDLARKIQELNEKEAKMPPSGDPYLWMVNTIQQFKANYKVEIPQVSTISYPDTGLFPPAHFPYKQAAITISGTGYYHDIGKFIADFENHFQHMRIQDLSLELPNGGSSSSDREKITFKMDIVALVKSGAS